MLNSSTESVVRSVTFDQKSPKWKQFAIPLSMLFCLISGLLLVLTIVFAILYGTERNKAYLYPTTTVSPTDELCLTPYCIKAANDLLGKIDESVDPCDNFYRFACGNWIKKARIPADADYQDTFEEMQKQVDNDIIDLLSATVSNGTAEPNSIVNARRLYASCVDEDAIEREDVNAILAFIDAELGSWPILLGAAWDPSTFNLSRSLLKLNEYNKFPLFDVATYVDEKNSSTNCIYIGQSSLGLGDRSYYENETQVTSAYRDFMKNLASALTNDTSMIDHDVIDIFDFEKSMAQYFWTTAQQYSGEFNRTTLANLSSIMNSSFDFADHLRRVYLLGNVTLLDQDIVTISELEVLRNVSAVFNRQTPRTLQNYLVWRFMMSQVEHMPKRFRAIKQQFNKVFRGVAAEKPRSTQCVIYTNRNMGFAVSKLYIAKHFDKNARKESLEMINNIRDVFAMMVNESTWMDAFSKRGAIEKLRAMHERIGYPDSLASDNVTQLENRYAGYIFNSSYMQNVLKVMRLTAKYKFEKLRKPIDRTAWSSMLPTDVNAQYDQSSNQMTFTAAILQPPFFHKDAPKYLNYGGIGTVIGHEFTHGFDTYGRQFDKDGNKLHWWTNETIAAFDQQKKCMIDQYNNYTVAQVNMQVNGEQTQGENMADNGGLKEAFYAYQKWTQANRNVDRKLPGLSKYSAEQMFFLNVGQQWCSVVTNQSAKNEVLLNVHSPAEFRVLGPTSNFAEFDRVFRCTPGQRNSRANKCVVW